MIVLIVFALAVLALIVWRAIDKVHEADVAGIVRFALFAIVTLVLTYVAMRVVPPEAVPDLMNIALRVLRAA
ncbi:hypothetical protein OG933_45405 (plasmid) [Streptomyces sp. NBC_00016]|uniref:hypothetical protein n=1 Tax=Streptomyces sp. NBC_00016 TaxID=2975622 RepID=UPI002F914A1C